MRASLWSFAAGAAPESAGISWFAPFGRTLRQNVTNPVTGVPEMVTKRRHPDASLAPLAIKRARWEAET